MPNGDYKASAAAAGLAQLSKESHSKICQTASSRFPLSVTALRRRGFEVVKRPAATEWRQSSAVQDHSTMPSLQQVI
ncbi:hypothetical protein WJX79_010934 [Trebouxia sp. C0005]